MKAFESIEGDGEDADDHYFLCFWQFFFFPFS